MERLAKNYPSLSSDSAQSNIEGGEFSNWNYIRPLGMPPLPTGQFDEENRRTEVQYEDNFMTVEERSIAIAQHQKTWKTSQQPEPEA